MRVSINFLMGILGKIGDAFKEIEYHTSDAPEAVGKRWEDHVESLFKSRYFVVVEKTHSFETNASRFVESSNNPDFILKYKPTGEHFAVECKFRTGLNAKRQLEWSNSAQLRRYQDFEQRRKMPVFVVIGFRETASSEIKMFNIPLSVAKYPALYESVFGKYERPVDKPFFWRMGMLS
jgi:hypothetical protein